jgi:hypothetical protein
MTPRSEGFSYRRVRCAVVPLMLALLMTACNSTPATTTSPTPTTPTTFTETFKGVLTKNNQATFPFEVSNPGTVTATLVSVSPDSTIVFGLSLGTWSGTSCTEIIANDQATQGSVITGTLSAAANLCVRAYDSQGNIVNPESYEVDANHP